MELGNMRSNNASLFSRARTTNSTPKRVRGFLGLPGEVRNRIYQYYFQEDFRCEIAAKGSNFNFQKPKTMKLCLGIVNKDRPIFKHEEKPKPDTPKTLRISRCLGHYKRVDGIRADWSNSLNGLILICKQVHCEAIVFLYHNTTFVFAAPRRLANFLDVVPKKNLSYVTKIHLHYASYGSPSFSKDRVWQTKHLASWTNACKAASKALVNLQELEIWLQVNHTPLRFDLRQSWLEPLLQFRRLTCVRKIKDNIEPKSASHREGAQSENSLQVVKVHFKTYWSSRCAFGHVSELADASANLHHLYAQAISRAILGSSEEDAMADFKDAWEVKYEHWQHFLNYSTPS